MFLELTSFQGYKMMYYFGSSGIIRVSSDHGGSYLMYADTERGAERVKESYKEIKEMLSGILLH